jgi:hypothetical protein
VCLTQTILHIHNVPTRPVEFDTSRWGERELEATLADGEDDDGELVANTNKRTFVESESEDSDSD